MSCFSFLAADFPEIHAEAVEAERLTLLKPRMACIYARRVVEQSVKWAFRYDRSLSTPFESTVSAMLHDPVFKALAGQQIFQRVHSARKLPQQWGGTLPGQLAYLRQINTGIPQGFDLLGGGGAIQNAGCQAFNVINMGERFF